MAKNLHLTHLEDAVLYNGVDGTRQAIEALRSLRDMLAGQTPKRFNTTVKWDGAPAVFAGSHPAVADGKFFVAKKGIFNKNPKVYTTDAEVDADTSGDLADKLKAALKYLPQLGIRGIVQGDMMFTDGDKRTEKIDGKNYITFQPNTIAYAVDAASPEGKRIAAAKIGIVFHTRYQGNDLENMNASFDVDASEFRKAMDVWYQDAQVRDVSGTATMTAQETAQVTQAISVAGKIFQRISGTTIRDIQNTPQIAQTIETYNNRLVRAGQNIGDTAAHTEGLIKFIQDKFGAEIEKRKTEKGKATQQAKLDEFMKFFSPENKANLKLVFDLQKAIVAAKLLIIRKLETISKMDTFVLTQNGYRATGEEGYVAIDRLNNGAYKLVDRMEFSTNNFNPDIIKGWQKPSAVKEEVMNEAEGKSIVTAFGRFNPPTVGHLKLIEKVASVAQGGEYRIYVSHSTNPKKNPLAYETKIAFMKDMFPKHADNIVVSDAKDPLQVLASLHEQGYTNVKFIAGSDRVEEYTARLSKYNGTESNSLYNFASLEFVSAGERDPDAEGVSGMSASKMRKAAADGDRESFQLGLPQGYNGDKLYTAVRKGMLIERARSLREELKKEYGKGLSKSTKSKRSAQFNKQAKMRDDDPAAYKPAPGDARAETKPSKHKSILDYAGEEGTDELVKKYKEDTPGQLNEISAAAEKNLKAKAKKSGIPYGILKQVYNRGMAAWKTGHRPGASQQAWAHARVNSFTSKSKGTWGGADKDLAAKARKAKKKKNEAVELAARINVVVEGVKKKSESWEDGYKRRVVKTTDADHKKDGYNWRIKGKERNEVTIKLYKNKPSFNEFKKQMRRVAGHEFGG